MPRKTRDARGTGLPSREDILEYLRGAGAKAGKREIARAFAVKGDDRVALLPSRGVSWSSGLEPPPHLVGERARALDVLADSGLVPRLRLVPLGVPQAGGPPGSAASTAAS